MYSGLFSTTKRVRAVVIKATALAATATILMTGGTQAQDTGSMEVGNTTVSVGAGPALLDLPDVPSLMAKTTNVGLPDSVIQTFAASDDLIDELGWNIGASISAPVGSFRTLSLSGFWSYIDDKDTSACAAAANEDCAVFALNDTAGVNNSIVTNAGFTVTDTTEREVDHWGVSFEHKWSMTPGVMGVTMAPPQRFFSLGADIRGIDQDLKSVIVSSEGGGRGPFTYNEDLDTRYYGIFAALGTDYRAPFLASMGFMSSIALRGGVYYAETDYDGRLIDPGVVFTNISSNASLSRDETAFIGGLVLETRKKIGARTQLSLKSEYEYYSYVPEMAYTNTDAPNTSGPQSATRIGSDHAFSARTMLRLTIGLGPSDLYQ